MISGEQMIEKVTGGVGTMTAKEVVIIVLDEAHLIEIHIVSVHVILKEIPMILETHAMKGLAIPHIHEGICPLQLGIILLPMNALPRERDLHTEQHPARIATQDTPLIREETLPQDIHTVQFLQEDMVVV